MYTCTSKLSLCIGNKPFRKWCPFRELHLTRQTVSSVLVCSLNKQLCCFYNGQCLTIWTFILSFGWGCGSHADQRLFRQHIQHKVGLHVLFVRGHRKSSQKITWYEHCSYSWVGAWIGLLFHIGSLQYLFGTRWNLQPNCTVSVYRAFMKFWADPLHFLYTFSSNGRILTLE